MEISQALNFPIDDDRSTNNEPVPISTHSLQPWLAETFDALIVVDDLGQYLEGNPAAWQLLHQSEADLLHKNIVNCFQPKPTVFPLIKTEIEPHRHQGKCQIVGTELSCESESVFPKTVEYRLVLNFKPHRHLFVIRDITQSQQAQTQIKQLSLELEQQNLERNQALQQKQELLSLIAANLPGAIYRVIYHANGDISMPFASEGYQNLLGVEPAVMMATPSQILECIHPSDRTYFWSALEQAKQTLTPGAIEYRVNTPDGRLIWLRDYARFTQTPSGDIIVDGINIDITDHKQLETAQQESEAKFQSIFEQTAVGIAYGNSNGCLIGVNPAFCQITGYSPEELQGISFSEITHPIDLEIEQEYVKKLLAQEIPAYTLEKRYIRKDQTFVWVSVTLSLIWDDQHQLKYGVAIVLDISDRKQTQESLYIRSKALEACANGIVITDRKGDILWVNPAFAHLTGYDFNETIGKNPRQLVNSGTHQTEFFRQLWQTILAGQVWRGQITNRRKDGSLYIEEMTITPVIDTQNQISHFIAIKQDISQRKQAELDLQESERRFRTVLETIALIGLMINCEGKIILCNDFLLELTSWRREEVLHQNWFEYFTPPEIRCFLEDELFQKALQGQGFPTHHENEIITRWGDRRTIAWSNTVFHDAQGQVISIASIGEDITDRKLAEAELHRSEERYRRIVETATEGIWEIDAESKTTFVNQHMAQMLGYTPAEMLGMCLTEFSDAPETICQSYIEQHRQGIHKQHDLKFRRKDGSSLWAIVSTTPIYDERGHYAGALAMVTDITGRKATELALQESEARLRLALKAAQMGSWDWDILTNTLLWSESLEQIRGMKPGSFDQHYQTFLNLVHPEDRSQILTAIHQAIEGNQDYQCDFRFVKPDHSIRWAVGRGKVLRDADGNPTRMIGVDVDITDLKHAEDTLRQQAERDSLLYSISQLIRRSLELGEILSTTVTEVLSLLHCDRVLIFRLNNSHHGCVETEALAPGCPSTQGESFWSDCFQHCTLDHCAVLIRETQTAQLFAAPEQFCSIYELLGLGMASQRLAPILHQDRIWGFLVVQQRLIPRIWQAWEVDLVNAIADQVSIAIQQSYLYQQVQAFNIHLERQVQERTIELWQSLHFEALLKRITDKVRDSLDEKQILQTAVQELIQGLTIEGCDTGIYNLDQMTSTIAHEATLTLKPAQGKTFSIPPTCHYAIYQHLFRGETCQFCELEPNQIRGDCHIYTVLTCPIIDDQGILGDLWLFKAYNQVFNDMEVRLVQQVANQCAIALRQSRLYQAAQAQVYELERLNQLKDDFLNTVSHELRTPMSTIKMALEVVEIKIKALGLLEPGSNLAQYFQILDQECNRETKLINNLLDISRLDAQADPLLLSQIDARIWIPAIVEPFEFKASQYQQDLRIEIAPDLNLIVTDLTYLERVMSELLQNACKYSPAHETIAIAVENISDPCPGIKIKISNSGVEIPTDELNRVFDKFYRIPNNDPWKYSGTGLGLFLVKKLVECLQGTIHAESYDNCVNMILTLPNLN